jgi:2-polyprenyl-3-methyl-5-hydroxy-6-metoxy-1,4-benzoquinol methylase
MMTVADLKRANEAVREAWNQNAAFWDERMKEGNDFVEVLIRPATERLLELQPGERVLDVACGNGLYARRLAAMGAEVVAFDIAKEMILRAQERTVDHLDRITYLVLDATDEAALLGLGEGEFDAVICNMALFDMAEIETLIRSVRRLLRPGGRFVFSVIHPCFNQPAAIHMAEMEEEGEVRVQYAVKVVGYMTPTTSRSAAIRGQPKPQLIFHRPLTELLGICFAAGFVLDGLEERAFPKGHPTGEEALSWGGNFSEIPPVLVARVR